MEIIGIVIVSVNKITDITFSKDCPGLGSFFVYLFSLNAVP